MAPQDLPVVPQASGDQGVYNCYTAAAAAVSWPAASVMHAPSAAAAPQPGGQFVMMPMYDSQHAAYGAAPAAFAPQFWANWTAPPMSSQNMVPYAGSYHPQHAVYTQHVAQPVQQSYTGTALATPLAETSYAAQPALPLPGGQQECGQWPQSISSSDRPGPEAAASTGGCIPYAGAEADTCALEERRDSVGSSSCSTAPSMRRRRKPRMPQAERKALAAKHQKVEVLVARLLQDKEYLKKQLSAGGSACASAIEELEGAVWRLSTNPDGCRLVQLAVEKAKGSMRSKLVEELHGHVREAMGSPHANYVLQKVVEIMPIDMASFIAVELGGIAADACRHRYGCRIMCRLTEQFAANPCVAKLHAEVMKDIGGLLNHSFGKYVVHAILEHGSTKQKHLIAEEIAKDVMTTAMNRNGSSVVERALMHCSEDDVAMLVGMLDDDNVLTLAGSQFGIFVVRALAHMPWGIGDRVVQNLETAPEEVYTTKHYQKLMQLLEDPLDDEKDDDFA